MKGPRIKWLFFAGVSLFVFLVYFFTQAPTVVFWDVGEFLAASVIAGVPHPPGMPLYVILGKFMTLLPLPLSKIYSLVNGVPSVEPVLRITLIPVTMGALTAGFAYLVAYEVMEEWRDKVSPWVAHISAVAGALIGAFAQVVWMNSIEAETYTPNAFFGILAVWLWMLLYKASRDDPKRGAKFLVLGAYLVFLSANIHLLSLVVFPALFAFVAIVRPKIVFDRPFLGVLGAALLTLGVFGLTYEPSPALRWMALGGLGLMAVFMYLDGHLKDLGSLWTIVFLAGAGAGAFGVFSPKNLLFLVGGSGLAILGMYAKAKLWKEWKGLTFLMILLALSVEAWLIIRGYYLHFHPTVARMNEADPWTWQAFMDVLTRKQYGPTEFFPRRIPLGDQFRLYWRYLSWQYILLIPIAFLGLLGLVSHFQRDRRRLFWLVGGAFLMLSVGLVLVLNLKDSPTQPVNPINAMRGLTEVRDRDYFFGPAHTMMGIMAAFGIYEIALLAKKYLKHVAWSYAVAGLGVLVGIHQMMAKWHKVDRSHFFLAEDSAHNLLIPADSGAVVFTNGDNDTFPVWFVQEVLKIRHDIVVANLSLLNTNWYCRQLKAWGAPIKLDYETIDRLPAIVVVRGKVVKVDPQFFWVELTTAEGKTKLVRFSLANPVLAGFYRGDRRAVARDMERLAKSGAETTIPVRFIRDIMIRDMLATSAGYQASEFVNVPDSAGQPIKLPLIYLVAPQDFAKEVFEGRSFRVPIYFAMTTTPEAWQGWEDHMLMEGMLLRMVPQKLGPGFMMTNLNPQRTEKVYCDRRDPVEFITEKSFDYWNVGQGVFRYRGVLDPRVWKEDPYETNDKIIRNYAQVAMSMAMYLGDRAPERSLRYLEAGDTLLGAISYAQGIGEQRLSIKLTKAELLGRLGKTQEALSLIQAAKAEAKVLNPQLVPIAEAKEVSLFLEMGRLAEAESSLVALEKKARGDPYVLYLKARLMLAKGDTAAAKGLLAEATKVPGLLPMADALAESLGVGDTLGR